MQRELPLPKLPTRDEARARRDNGIERAAAHAEQELAGWRETAIQFLRRYAESHVDFLAEDVIDAALGTVPMPPDSRAWGAVFRRAAKEAVIEKLGYRPAKTSNLSPKVYWGSLVLDLHAQLDPVDWKKLARNYVRAYRMNVSQDVTLSTLVHYAMTMGCPSPTCESQWTELLREEGLEPSGDSVVWRQAPCCAACAEMHDA
jgi:hypothetical protein